MPQTPRSTEYWGLRNSAASTIALTTSAQILTSGAALGALAAMPGGSDTLTTSESASAFTASSGEYVLRTTGRTIKAYLRLKASKSAAGESVTFRLVAGAAGDLAGVGATIWQHTAILSVADSTNIQQVVIPIQTLIPPAQGGVLTLQALASGNTNLVIAAADDLLFVAEVMQHRVGYAV